MKIAYSQLKLNFFMVPNQRGSQLLLKFNIIPIMIFFGKLYAYFRVDWGQNCFYYYYHLVAFANLARIWKRVLRVLTLKNNKNHNLNTLGLEWNPNISPLWQWQITLVKCAISTIPVSYNGYSACGCGLIGLEKIQVWCS